MTLLRPTQKVKVLVNIFAPFNTVGTWAVCIKFLEKNARGFYVIVIVHVKWKGRMKIWRFRPISRFISKTVKDTAIVTYTRTGRIGTRMRSVEWCHLE